MLHMLEDEAFMGNFWWIWLQSIPTTGRHIEEKIIELASYKKVLA